MAAFSFSFLPLTFVPSQNTAMLLKLGTRCGGGPRLWGRASPAKLNSRQYEPPGT